MANKIKSIRGEIVDFDLFTIKQQILNTPKNENTKNRERFIDKKRRRTNRNTIDQLLTQQQQNAETVRNALAKQKQDPKPSSDNLTESNTTSVTPTDTVTAIDPKTQIIRKK